MTNAQKLDVNKSITYKGCDTGTVKVVSKHSTTEPAIEEEDPNQTRIRIPSPEVAMLQLVNLVATMSILLKPCWQKRPTTNLKVRFEDVVKLEVYTLIDEDKELSRNYREMDTRWITDSVEKQIDPFERKYKKDREINMISDYGNCTGCSKFQIEDNLELKYVQAKLGDIEITMLLDTGSTSTLLGKNFMGHTHAERCTNPYMVLLAANKSHVNVMAHLDTNISLFGMHYKHKFLIADLEKNILGWDFITKHRLVIVPDPFMLIPMANFRPSLQTERYVHSLIPHQVEIGQTEQMKVTLGVKTHEIESYFSAMREKYPEVFDPTVAFQDKHTVSFKIELQENKTFKKPYVYQVAFNLRDKVKEKIAELLKMVLLSQAIASMLCRRWLYQRKMEKFAYVWIFGH